MQFYEQIEECLHQQQPLNEMITELYSILLPKRKFRTNGLNQQQSLALVYEHMRAPLNKLMEQIESEVKQNIELTHEEDEGNDLVQEENEGEEDYHEEVGQNGDDAEQQMGDEQFAENEIEQQAQNEQELDDEGEMGSEDDVGLYGEEIDEQDMESYENEEMEDDPEFGNFKLNKMSQQNREGEGEQDEYIEDNFDQFRQIQMENQAKEEKEPTQLQKQIQKLEERALKGKNWVLGGEVKAKERPVNSLLDAQLQFKSGVKYSHEINQTYNSNLQNIIKQRVLDEIYDDRVRFIPNSSFTKGKLEDISRQKSNKGLAELYEIEFKNSLGIGDHKNEGLKKEIIDSFKQINYLLDCLSNTAFALKPVSNVQKNGAEAIVAEDKIPITSWNGTVETPHAKLAFESEKQINKKTKRLRNKRNARQRKKQQDRKRTNKAIQYGGMTKFEAEARKKIAKTKQSVQVKYNKSQAFFSNINNKNKAGKPNPNIRKLQL